MKKTRFSKIVTRKHGSSLAEFGPALFVFLLIILFPMINLVGFAMSVGTVELIARQTALRASTASTYDTAIVAVQQEATTMLNSGFGKFANVTPVGGINGCGADVYVHGTNINTKVVTTYGPNTPVPAPIDTTDTIWEYSTQVNYVVHPFLNLAGVPFIGNVPMVGQSAPMKLAWDMAAEYPEGLAGNGGIASLGGGSGTNGTMAPGGGMTPGGGLGSGRNGAPGGIASGGGPVTSGIGAPGGGIGSGGGGGTSGGGGGTSGGGGGTSGGGGGITGGGGGHGGSGMH